MSAVMEALAALRAWTISLMPCFCFFRQNLNGAGHAAR